MEYFSIYQLRLLYALAKGIYNMQKILQNLPATMVAPFLLASALPVQTTEKSPTNTLTIINQTTEPVMILPK